MTPSNTAVERRQDQTPATSGSLRDNYQQLLQFVDEIPAVDPELMQLEIVRRIMAADTLEEATALVEATPAASLDGRRLSVRGVAWVPSAFDEGPPVYALIDVADPGTGEQFTTSMGGASAMAVLRWAELHNAMPFDIVLRRRASRTNPERSFWTLSQA